MSVETQEEFEAELDALAAADALEQPDPDALGDLKEKALAAALAGPWLMCAAGFWSWTVIHKLTGGMAR